MKSHLLPALALLFLTSASHASTEEKFEIDGAKVSLKIPTTAAEGKPWLWIGEFAGHLKTLEAGLVENGWHVAYVAQSDKFGSPNAMAVWEKLYTELHTNRGLSAKPALLGISRGGLYVNAWLRLHPDRARVLYLDNAVCDPRSWPGGFELTKKGRGSKGDWTKYKTEFGFADDESAIEKSIRPTDQFLPAVQAGVLLISCHGTADRIVPYEDNAAKLVEFWEQNDGRVKVFPKENGDHHPHGLPDPKPIIDLLVAEGK
jgi:pimeloyl-ACP methyl ester carboxylesterase